MELLLSIFLCEAVYGAVSWKSKQHSKDPSQGSSLAPAIVIRKKTDENTVSCGNERLDLCGCWCRTRNQLRESAIFEWQTLLCSHST
jgi:hypothetical protein